MAAKRSLSRDFQSPDKKVLLESPSKSKKVSLSGHVSNVSKVVTVPSKKDGRPVSYFRFTVHSKDSVRSAVCFSPQKYDLIKGVDNSITKKGISAANVMFERDEYKFNSYSTVKQITLDYPKITLVKKFTSISKAINELDVQSAINIKGKISNITKINSAKYLLHEAFVGDTEGGMPITFFGDLPVEEGLCYSITHVLITVFDGERKLRATSQSAIEKIDDIFGAKELSFLVSDDKTDVILEIVMQEMEGKVVGVDMKTLKSLFYCMCGSQLMDDDIVDGIASCTTCSSMSSEFKETSFIETAFLSNKKVRSTLKIPKAVLLAYLNVEVITVEDVRELLRRHLSIISVDGTVQQMDTVGVSTETGEDVAFASTEASA